MGDSAQDLKLESRMWPIYPFKAAPPTGPTINSKSADSWGPNVQMHEPMWDISYSSHNQKIHVIGKANKKSVVSEHIKNS